MPNSKQLSPKEAINKLKKFHADRQGRPCGTVKGGSDQFHYVWADATEIKPGRMRKLRDDWTERGFWKVEDPSVYVPEVSTAEIWATHAEAADVAFELRRARNEELLKSVSGKKG